VRKYWDGSKAITPDLKGNVRTARQDARPTVKIGFLNDL
jgi:hypothetical protein